MKEKKFEKRCPGPVDCFGDREVLFRKVLIPMAMGDDTKFPPKNGAYRNSLVVYEANGAIYIYSSDGLYTKLSVASGVNSVNGMSGDVNLFIPEKLSELQNDTGFITKDVDDLTNYPKLSDLAQVAISGSYLDLSNKPAINNGQLTINRNGSTVGSFKANQSQDTTVNIRVPVYTNELINNSQFVVDGNYVHTDNNFNNSWKNKLAHLADIQTIGSNLTLTNGRLDATGGVTPGDISSAIAAHNTSPTAHQDIRDDISVTIEGQTFNTNQEFADFLIPAINEAFEGVADSIDDIQELIPSQASVSNQLADKNFVNSSVQTATANFRGNWDDWADVPTVASDYPVDYAGNKTPTVNDYLVVQDASDYTLETLEGTWRFKYTGNWDVDGKAGWHPEYQVNETPLTAAQLAALNSGITDTLVANIPTDPLAEVAYSGDYSDLINKPNAFLIRGSLNSGSNLNALSTGIWEIKNVTHADFPQTGAQFGVLVQYSGDYKPQMFVAGGAGECSLYYRRWLTASNSFTPWSMANDVVWVEYGTTTYAEITTLIANNKEILCARGSRIYRYSYDTGTDYVLTCLTSVSGAWQVKVSNANNWSTGSATLQKVSNMIASTDATVPTDGNYYSALAVDSKYLAKTAIDTTIDSSSTDAEVASAKAVYDIVGDIETLLYTLNSGGGAQ